jgi:hypothetical protein
MDVVLRPTKRQQLETRIKRTAETLARTGLPKEDRANLERIKKQDERELAELNNRPAN